MERRRRKVARKKKLQTLGQRKVSKYIIIMVGPFQQNLCFSSQDLPQHATKQQLSPSNMRALEKAMNICVMMSQLHGPWTKEHWKNCLAALGYCFLMWKVCKSTPHQNFVNYKLLTYSQNTLESYSQLSPGAGKTDLQLPTSVQKWIQFTPSDEVNIVTPYSV